MPATKNIERAGYIKALLPTIADDHEILKRCHLKGWLDTRDYHVDYFRKAYRGKLKAEALARGENPPRYSVPRTWKRKPKTEKRKYAKTHPKWQTKTKASPIMAEARRSLRRAEVDAIYAPEPEERERPPMLALPTYLHNHEARLRYLIEPDNVQGAQKAELRRLMILCGTNTARQILAGLENGERESEDMRPPPLGPNDLVTSST